MKLKKGDFIRLKPMNEILNENKIINISSEGVIKFKNDRPIYKTMYWYFGKDFRVDLIVGDAFYIKGCKYGFSNSWIESINNKKMITNSRCLNVCKKEHLKFLNNKKEIELKVRQFMEEYNKENPIYEISSTDRGYLFINNGAVGTFISTEYRFTTEDLAQKCLDLVGENNWKKYILGMKET